MRKNFTKLDFFSEQYQDAMRKSKNDIVPNSVAFVLRFYEHSTAPHAEKPIASRRFHCSIENARQIICRALLNSLEFYRLTR